MPRRSDVLSSSSAASSSSVPPAAAATSAAAPPSFCKPSHHSFPSVFQSCVEATDLYCRSLNLRPHIRKLPVDEETVNQIKHRMKTNRSFVKSPCNPQPDEYSYPEFDCINSNKTTVDAVLQEGIEESTTGLIVLLTQPTKTTTTAAEAEAAAEAITENSNTNNNTNINETSDDSLYGAGCDSDLEEYSMPFRVVCGVVIKLIPSEPSDDNFTPAFNNSVSSSSSNSNNDHHHYNQPSSYDDEREITGVFCLPSMPVDVATELIRVALARAMAEGLCYEEVAEKDLNYQCCCCGNSTSERGFGRINENPEYEDLVTRSAVGAAVGAAAGAGPTASIKRARRSKTQASEDSKQDDRFVSINACGLLVSPSVCFQLIQQKFMKFNRHVQEVSSSSPSSSPSPSSSSSSSSSSRLKQHRREQNHRDDRTCSCLRIFHKKIKAFNGDKETSVYTEHCLQYFSLRRQRAKGLAEQWVPERPSQCVLQYFKPNPQTDENNSSNSSSNCSWLFPTFCMYCNRRQELPPSTCTSSAHAVAATEGSIFVASAVAPAAGGGGAAAETDKSNKRQRQRRQRQSNKRQKQDRKPIVEDVIEFDSCSESSTDSDITRSSSNHRGHQLTFSTENQIVETTSTVTTMSIHTEINS